MDRYQMANIGPCVCVVTRKWTWSQPFSSAQCVSQNGGMVALLDLCVCRQNGDTFNSLDLFVSFPFRPTSLSHRLPLLPSAMDIKQRRRMLGKCGFSFLVLLADLLDGVRAFSFAG